MITYASKWLIAQIYKYAQIQKWICGTMKVLNLKLIAIAFIAIFCIAPLCAVELNQDGGNDTENYTVESEIEDIEEDAAQIDSQDCMVESEDVNEDSAQPKLGAIHYYFPPLNVHIDDVKRGDTLVIDLDTEYYVSSGVYLLIQSSGYSSLEFQWIDNGHGQFCMDTSSMPTGTYKVKIFSHIDDYHTMIFETVETSFTIS